MMRMNNTLRILGYGVILVGIAVLDGLISGAPLGGNALIANIFGALLIACFFAWMIPQIKYHRLDLAIVLFVSMLVVIYISNILEAMFFVHSPFQFSRLLIVLPKLLVEAFTAAWIFHAAQNKESFSETTKKFFSARPWTSWLWRIPLASLMYFPVYFFFGILISPFVVPIYQSNPQLIIPPFSSIIPLEIVRGFLYVLALLPLLMGWKGKRGYAILALAGFLYIPGAFVPLLTTSLPREIVPFHMGEILGDSLLFAFIVAKLLSPKTSKRNA